MLAECGNGFFRVMVQAHKTIESSGSGKRERVQTASSLAVGMLALVLNAGLESTVFTLALIGSGACLLVTSRANLRFKRRKVLIVGVVAFLLLLGAFVEVETEILLPIGLRILCGIVWVLWLGTQVDLSLIHI